MKTVFRPITKTPRLLITFLTLATFAPSFAFAQFPTTLSAQGTLRSPRTFGSPLGSPTTSPYLNLLRNGSTLGNYYGLVRPEQQIRAANRQLQLNAYEFNQAASRRQFLPNSPNERDPYGLGPSRVPQTGHGVRFMTDLRGQYQAFNQTLKSRRLGVIQRANTSAYRLPASGHSSFFGNSYQYYPR